MPKFLQWIHHLMNPHCLECEQARLDSLVCASCETLKQQLDISNNENRRLLEVIVELNTPPEVASVGPRRDIKPIQPRMVPWSVRKQMLEEQDRVLAQTLARRVPETDKEDTKLEELEKEVLHPEVKNGI